ncbi:hypothetical protein F2P81_015688 [Scophthalmus maximus]|uniref:Uncharacterized protein n=1 Tax=Scophthalmus maximus TaxID=52904 RepID=A0A6A4SA60_SCOMX|nr:hypothetical protein F2P81_015688 [Scophthalmus maximus]
MEGKWGCSVLSPTVRCTCEFSACGLNPALCYCAVLFDHRFRCELVARGITAVDVHGLLLTLPERCVCNYATEIEIVATTELMRTCWKREKLSFSYSLSDIIRLRATFFFLRDDSQSSGTSGEADGGGRGGNARLPIRIPPRKAAVVCYQNYNEHFHNVASRCTELYRIATHEAAGGDGDVTAESKRIGSIKDMPLQKAFTFPRTDWWVTVKENGQIPAFELMATKSLRIRVW